MTTYIKHLTKDGNPKEKGKYPVHWSYMPEGYIEMADYQNGKFYSNAESNGALAEYWLEPVSPGMTLQEAKDKVAKDKGFDSWEDMYDKNDYPWFVVGVYTELCELYMASATAGYMEEIEKLKEGSEVEFNPSYEALQQEANELAANLLESQQKAAAFAEALEEAKLQIEYLHSKFQETGTGNATLSRIESALAAFKGE